MVKNMKVFTYLCPSNWKAAKKKTIKQTLKTNTHIFQGFVQTISWQNGVQESINFYQVEMGGRFPQHFLK